LGYSQTSRENSWETKQPVPQAVVARAVTVNDKIYLFYNNGSDCAAFTYMYDPETQFWAQKKSMPTYRTGYALAVVGDKIYTIGGQHYYRNPGSSAIYGNSTSITEVYDTLTDSWETKEPLPDAHSNLIANTINGKVYVMSWSDMAIYDPVADSWEIVSSLPSQVLNPYYSCVIDDQIYFIQDSIGNAVDSSVIGEGRLHIYNTKTGNWSTGATLSTFYKHPAVVATTGEHAPKQIYVIGGYIPVEGDFANYKPVNSTYVYNPTTDIWIEAADLPTARYSSGVTVLNDKIYVIGGALNSVFGGPNNTVDTVEVFTPFGYGTLQSSGVGSQPILIENTALIAGVVVAAAVVAVAGVVVYHFRHSVPKTPPNKS
jgi:N-acetylneuraminic acid mutarotase